MRPPGYVPSLCTQRLILSSLVALTSLLAEPAPAPASPGASATSPAAARPRDMTAARVPKKAQPSAQVRAKSPRAEAATAPGRPHATLPEGLLSRVRPPGRALAEPNRLPEPSPTALIWPPWSGETPFIWPVMGSLNSPFGPRRARFHAGIDIGARHAEPVVAAGAGNVLYARPTRGPLGKAVVLEHADGLRTVYAHLSRIVVKEGAMVRQGDPIGAVGRTGRATGPHLHFEVHRDGMPVAPQAFLPAAPVELVRGPAALPVGHSSVPLGAPPQSPGAAPASVSARSAESTS